MQPSDAPHRPRPRPRPAGTATPAPVLEAPVDTVVVDTGPLGFWVDERSTIWTRLLDRRDEFAERQRNRLRRAVTPSHAGGSAPDPRKVRAGGIGAIACGVGLFVAGTLVTPLAGAEVAQGSVGHGVLSGLHQALGR